MRSLLILLALLVGCSSPGLVWQTADINGQIIGALSTGNTRPLVQQNCGTSKFMSPHGTTCSFAFIDYSGSRVNIFELLDRIDKVAERIEALRPWINKISDRKDERLFPYRMHLLTVSPAIVLVVPRPSAEIHESCGFLLRTGCIQSQSFRGNSYWFRGNPSVQNGSFWFNLDEPKVINPLISQSNIQITSGGATLRLVMNNSEWLVYRD